jgi:hypothetical protein
METTRIPLAQILAPRNAVNNGKDGMLRNCYKEKTPSGEQIVKRPGLEINTLLPAGCAQGSFVYNGTPYYIIGGTIYALPDETVVGPGGGGGGGGIDASDWELIGTIAENFVGGSSIQSFLGNLYVATTGNIYRSEDDGVTWTNIAVIPSGGSDVLVKQSLMVLGATLYFVMFYSGSPAKSTCYSTTDGTTWNTLGDFALQVGAFPDAKIWVPECSVADSNYLYVVMHYEANNYNPGDHRLTTFRSSNGVTWSQMGTVETEDYVYFNTSVTILNGVLYIIGGQSNATYRARVYTSSDQGVTLTQLTNAAAFGGRQNVFCWGIANKLYVMGGQSPGTLSSIYQSTDGSTWSLVDSTTSVGTAYAGGFCTHENRLYLTKTGTAQVWRTTGASPSYPIPF